MFLSIYCNATGDEYIKELGPKASLDLRQYVKDWVALEYDNTKPVFSMPGLHIPNGCGAYQAEFRSTERKTGSCWLCEPFFLVYAYA